MGERNRYEFIIPDQNFDTALSLIRGNVLKIYSFESDTDFCFNLHLDGEYPYMLDYTDSFNINTKGKTYLTGFHLTEGPRYAEGYRTLHIGSVTSGLSKLLGDSPELRALARHLCRRTDAALCCLLWESQWQYQYLFYRGRDVDYMQCDEENRQISEFQEICEFHNSLTPLQQESRRGEMEGRDME